MVDRPVYIGGHSLGGADAYCYAFSRIRRGLRVDGVLALAPARPGDSTMGRVLASAGVSVRAVGNAGDPIPSVPWDMPLLGEHYQQPFPLEPIDEAPAPGSDIIFARHQVVLYQRGCRGLPQGRWPFALDDGADQVARLYDDPTGWAWINPVDGLYWAMIEFGDARLMIRRGSHTRRDWFREDFDAVEVSVHGAMMSGGFWQGVGPIEAALDAQLT